MLQRAFLTANPLTFPVSAPGSAGMEACFVNLVEPGDKVIVCRNGVFAGRMQENVERAGGVAVMVEHAWGTPVDPHKLEDALKLHRDAKIVAFVHAETSTGALSDAPTLAQLARRYGCISIVDAVTSLGCSPLKVDEWGLDAVYSCSQKGLSCTPGLSPLTFGERAAEKIRRRKTKVQSWFLDVSLVMGYWGDGMRVYHHTAPIHPLYGLHEALVMLHEEGLERSWARHRTLHLALRAGIEAMGLSFLVAENARLPQLNAILVPSGVNDADVRSMLLNDYGIEIGAGLGDLAGKVWRIGLMGYGANPKNVLYCLGALDAVLSHLRAPIRQGVAVAAANQAIG